MEIEIFIRQYVMNLATRRMNLINRTVRVPADVVKIAETATGNKMIDNPIEVFDYLKSRHIKNVKIMGLTKSAWRAPITRRKIFDI